MVERARWIFQPPFPFAICFCFPWAVSHASDVPFAGGDAIAVAMICAPSRAHPIWARLGTTKTGALFQRGQHAAVTRQRIMLRAQSGLRC
jgi:hypothetical protein